MRIHQITDLHVPDDDSDESFAHVRENIKRQLQFIESEQPDLLVISGDLTMKDRSEVSCRWVESNLPHVPVVVIPGNHDDPAIISNKRDRVCLRTQHMDCYPRGPTNLPHLRQVL